MRFERCDAIEPDPQAGRWRLFARVAGRRWRLVVEPDSTCGVVVVITAFPETGP